MIKKAYLYFGCKVGDQDKSWSPLICFGTCCTNLGQWLNGKLSAMPFGVPMIWREQKDHSTDCYFCMTNIAGFSSKNKNRIIYPNLSSAMRPVEHNKEIPIPKPPENWDMNDTDMVAEDESDEDLLYEPPDSSEPHLLCQSDLNDLVRDLNLTKAQSELLGSRLQGWNLLAKSVTISSFLNRHKKLAVYFSMIGSLYFCNDISGLMAALHC